MDKAMREFENLKWPMGVRDKTHIAVLSAITLVIGIYFLSTTVLIAEDGTFYIEMARKIADDSLKAIHDTGQAPGYPFLIYLTHQAMGLFYGDGSLQGWIISAQAVSLLSKLIATIALYFVGSYFVGSRFSFWGVLILSILPDSVDYGSDALTDWSNILFLAIGFLLLLLGVQYRKRWIFGYAGIAAGLGYLTRPECGQVVLYGSTWLLFNLIRPQGKMKRIKAAGALSLLLAGFAVIAVPYILSKGYVFPEPQIWKLPALLSMGGNNTDSTLNVNLCLAGLSIGKIIGSETLITSACETLMYYFVPALLIGSHTYFRKQSKKAEQTFFAAAFIIVNVAIVVLWQQLYSLPLSRRYVLPLIAFTIFYIPLGLHGIACWLSRRMTNGTVAEEKIRRCFFILIAIGISICAVKLIRMAPLRWEKQSYRDTAQWLSKNTAPADMIAVPDERMAFYAQRQGLKYYGANIPPPSDYIVKIVKNEEVLVAEKDLLGAKKVFSVANDNSRASVEIYDIRGYISEELDFVDYHCEKISDERYRFHFVFEVNCGFGKDWIIYFRGYVKDEHVPRLSEKRRKYKYDNWSFKPKPATSAWPINERVTIMHEISAKPIPYNLTLGLYGSKEDQHGRLINLGWVDFGGIKQNDGK